MARLAREWLWLSTVGLPLLTFAGCPSSEGALRDIDAATLETMRADGQPLLLLDVRTSEEFAAGRIPGAENRPVETIVDWWSDLDPAQRTVCYCKGGTRSRRAGEFLVSKGFTDVSNLLGGFDAWPGDTER